MFNIIFQYIIKEIFQTDNSHRRKNHVEYGEFIYPIIKEYNNTLLPISLNEKKEISNVIKNSFYNIMNTGKIFIIGKIQNEEKSYIGILKNSSFRKDINMILVSIEIMDGKISLVDVETGGIRQMRVNDG